MSNRDLQLGITDILLFIETGIFVLYFLTKRLSRLKQEIFVLLFYLLFCTASLSGAIFHLFFVGKDSSIFSELFWYMVVLSIGYASSAALGIAGYLVSNRPPFNRTFLFLTLVNTLLVTVMVFTKGPVFNAVLYFFIPPVVILSTISIINLTKKNSLSYVFLLVGIFFYSISPYVKRLPDLFVNLTMDASAWYHIVQGISLLFLFMGFKRIFRRG